MLSPTQSSTRYSTTPNNQYSTHPESSNTNETINNLFSAASEKSSQLSQADKQQSRKLRKEKNRAAKEERRITKSQAKSSPTDSSIPIHGVFNEDKINSLRFSQDSICEQTRNGESLNKLKENISKGWKKAHSLRIVKMPDEEYTSLDNRRLFVAKEICSNGSPIAVEVDIYDHSKKAPPKLFNGIVHEYRSSRRLDDIENVSEKIIQKSYGHCAALRINTRSGDLKANNFGFSKMPDVRKA